MLQFVFKVTSPFAGALRDKKNCIRASFNKTPTNYISEESLIDVRYEKNTISAMLSFRKNSGGGKA